MENWMKKTERRGLQNNNHQGDKKEGIYHPHPVKIRKQAISMMQLESSYK